MGIRNFGYKSILARNRFGFFKLFLNGYGIVIPNNKIILIFWAAFLKSFNSRTIASNPCCYSKRDGLGTMGWVSAIFEQVNMIISGFRIDVSLDEAINKNECKVQNIE